MARAKRKLPAKPAGFVFPQHRDHFCPVIRFPNTKTPPPSTIHTPQKSRPGQTSSTGIRTQKLRCRSERRRPVLFFRITAVTPAAVIRFPNTKPPPPTTIHTPQKPHGPVKRHRPIPEHKKNPLPLRTPPAGFVFSHHRSPSCCRHPIPEHKAPAADNTHPSKTSRLGQTAPTDARTQKTRCRSEHRRPFPLSLKKPQRCLNAIVQRQPPPAGAQHHLTQSNPNISGRRFTAFFALRCL